MFSLAHVSAVRKSEIERVIPWFGPGARILEIGAGTGEQAKALADRGFDVSAIELVDSRYVSSRVYPVIEYDGRVIPFSAASFDIVYSSNVLEHVTDLSQMHWEIWRVLRPGGRVVHVLPTHWWRLWTMVTGSLKRHGERGNLLTEMWYSHPAWWRQNFRQNGFEVLRDEPMGLFYTGNMIFGTRWPMKLRERLSRIFGSACHVFELKVAADA